MKKTVYDTPQFVEGITIKVAPADIQRYLQTEEDLFLEGLTATPGFLGGEVWLSEDKPGEVTTFYFWESEDAYKSVDPVWLSAQKKAITEAVPAEFIRAWHGEDRRFRVKEYR